MNWLKQLFGLSQTSRPAPKSIPSSQAAKPVVASPAAAASKARTDNCTTAAAFPQLALIGPARCLVSIKEMPEVSASLAKALGDTGISNNGILELLSYGLLGVCPRCNQYCAGKAIFMLKTMSLMGSVVFTGNSGGAERLMEGKCSNYSCENTTFELFWCPDLDPGMLTSLRSRGIQIDPNTQQHRDPYWKPKH